jgi:hypothetical protein
MSLPPAYLTPPNKRVPTAAQGGHQNFVPCLFASFTGTQGANEPKQENEVERG